MESPIDYYRERAGYYKKQLSEIQSRYQLISFLRLVSFLAFLIAGYQWLSLRSGFLLALAIFSIICFVILVRVALKLNDKKALLQKLLFINENEISILQHQPSGFNDAQQLATNDDYSGDLDIFGPSSLFQLLNRTTTYHGTRQLAGLLQHPLLSKETIELYQQAVQTLAPQKDLRQLITAYGIRSEEHTSELQSPI